MDNFCDLCRGYDFEGILDMGVQPLAENDNGKRYPLRLVRCRRCSLIQLSESPPQQEIFAPDHPYASGNSRERTQHFAGLAEKIVTLPELASPGEISVSPGELPDDAYRELQDALNALSADPAWKHKIIVLPSPVKTKTPLIVDIGANDGTLLKQIRKLAPGIGLLAVEPTNQVTSCYDAGIPAWKEFFTEDTGVRIAGEKGNAAVITACNVLAHVPDIHDVLNGIQYLLDPDGIFITENHDWNSVSRGLQVDTVYHEHLRYFTIATLSRLLDEHGLTVTDVERIQAHGGSFRVTARKEPGRLEERAQAARTALRELLRGLGAVYGIGATTRATPLIHYAGLQQWLQCVCEVPSSGKIGLFIPGTRIPVVDEKKLIEDQPPYALLLSWHIRDYIVPKLRELGYHGKFIVPLPEPEVLSD
jgi:hypothetical protein